MNYCYVKDKLILQDKMVYDIKKIIGSIYEGRERQKLDESSQNVSSWGLQERTRSRYLETCCSKCCHNRS